MFVVYYLKTAGYRLDYNGAPIGNGIYDIMANQNYSYVIERQYGDLADVYALRMLFSTCLRVSGSGLCPRIPPGICPFTPSFVHLADFFCAAIHFFSVNKIDYKFLVHPSSTMPQNSFWGKLYMMDVY